MAARLAANELPCEQRIHRTTDRRGVVWDLDCADHLQRILLLTGVYEEPVISLLDRHLAANDVVLDVGANVGAFALTCAQKLRSLGGGKVYAFEPAPDTADQLSRNVANNSMEELISIHRKGLGAHPADLPLHFVPSFGEEDLGTRTLAAIDDTGGTAIAHIPVVRGDDELLALGVAGFDVLKLDVEGWELEALTGLAEYLGSDRPRLCIVEINPVSLRRAAVRPKEIFDFMYGKGYRPLPIKADIAGLRRRLTARKPVYAGNVAFVRL